MPPVDDITLGEVARLIRRMEASQEAQNRRIDEGLAALRAEISARLDRTVSSDIYTIQYAALQAEVAELKAELVEVKTAMAQQDAKHADQLRHLRGDLASGDDKRRADRKWWLSAVSIPTVALLAQYVGPVLGIGS